MFSIKPLLYGIVLAIPIYIGINLYCHITKKEKIEFHVAMAIVGFIWIIAFFALIWGTVLWHLSSELWRFILGLLRWPTFLLWEGEKTMKLTIIIAAIIIAFAIVLSNGIYVPLVRGTYLNKFTGACFTPYGEEITKTLKARDLLKDELKRKNP